MPYTYKKENGKYCVYKKDGGKKVGCTKGTKEALEKYLTALRMHEEDKMSGNKINNSTITELKKMVSVAVKDVLKEGITMQRKVQQQQEQEQPTLTAEEKKQYLEAISRFNEYGEAIYRGNNLKEALKNIKQVVEFASKNMVEESGDWFDGVTVSRHSKRMQESMKIFEKTITETIKLQQRMESVYEDMGHMLSRYYEIKDNKTESPTEAIKESTINETESAKTAQQATKEVKNILKDAAGIDSVKAKTVSFQDLARTSKVIVRIECSEKLDTKVIEQLKSVSKAGNYMVMLNGKAYMFGGSVQDFKTENTTQPVKEISEKTPMEKAISSMKPHSKEILYATPDRYNRAKKLLPALEKEMLRLKYYFTWDDMEKNFTFYIDPNRVDKFKKEFPTLTAKYGLKFKIE